MGDTHFRFSADEKLFNGRGTEAAVRPSIGRFAARADWARTKPAQEDPSLEKKGSPVINQGDRSPEWSDIRTFAVVAGGHTQSKKISRPRSRLVYLPNRSEKNSKDYSALTFAFRVIPRESGWAHSSRARTHCGAGFALPAFFPASKLGGIARWRGQILMARTSRWVLRFF